MRRPKALKRLLRIRELQEERKRCQLEAALARLDSLEKTRDAAAEMERRGRMLVGTSVLSGEIADRQAGLMQSEFASRRGRILATRIALTQKETIELRQEFMDKRVERQQAETLVDLENSKDKVESDRRSQRSMDDWFAARTRRTSNCYQNRERASDIQQDQVKEPAKGSRSRNFRPKLSPF